MDRQQAWDLLCEYTKNENLRKHALAVEAAMRAYAHRFGENEELWGIVGLIHDFDYEKHPTAEEHPFKGAEILRERGWPEEIVRAVLSHARYSGVRRESALEKSLFAVDELTGLITAVALVRPSKDIRDVKVRSVRKKWKDRSFAAGVDRTDVEEGAAGLGIELNEHIAVVLEAMQSIADKLGLAGTEG
ncbi:MAG: HDIG domain-containing protein [Anaerolineae bacterium]|nr:MAG: HDIG domain-containing protein [Anaerolineae bacterium]